MPQPIVVRWQQYASTAAATGSMHGVPGVKDLTPAQLRALTNQCSSQSCRSPRYLLAKAGPLRSMALYSQPAAAGEKRQERRSTAIQAQKTLLHQTG